MCLLLAVCGCERAAGGGAARGAGRGRGQRSLLLPLGHNLGAPAQRAGRNPGAALAAADGHAMLVSRRQPCRRWVAATLHLPSDGSCWQGSL